MEKLYTNFLLFNLSLEITLFFVFVCGLLMLGALLLAIRHGKRKSDKLLLNILPERVAIELKETGKAKAKLHDPVTVLFTDFEGFTELAVTLSPEQLVAELDECFCCFDRIMSVYGIEKIKTIGDAYMAVGGLPTPTQTHAIDVVNAALEIQQFMIAWGEEREAEGRPSFKVRIGVHTGPVVAGVVGFKKFQYDIWGDTVNVAARLEKADGSGKVNISTTTYELIKDKFLCEHRGKIAVKGKGELDMYYVISRK